MCIHIFTCIRVNAVVFRAAVVPAALAVVMLVLGSCSNKNLSAHADITATVVVVVATNSVAIVAALVLVQCSVRRCGYLWHVWSENPHSGGPEPVYARTHLDWSSWLALPTNLPPKLAII